MNHIEKLYSDTLDRALDKHFPSASGRDRLRARLQLKHGMVCSVVQDYAKTAAPHNKEGIRGALHIARKLADWRPDFGASDASLIRQTELDPALKNSFSIMHDQDAEKFQEFLNGHIEKSAQFLWGEHAISASVLDTSNKISGEILHTSPPIASEKSLLARSNLVHGGVVLAGVGLIGHGVYKAAMSVEADENEQKHRQWAKTVAHAAEAAAGAALAFGAARGFGR